jgi:cellulose synthase/poly-beta-1,6-N-acetylglucosamine synthase-like glycosyltransferase
MTIFHAALWTSLFLLAWPYVLYPCLLQVLARIRNRPWRTASWQGRVSWIVAAHNEEQVIREKVENSCGLDFGAAEPEVIVVSDGSEDATNRILEDLETRFEALKVITYQPRAGKAHAINRAVSEATGDALVFTDANVMVDRDAPRALLGPLEDPLVGAVCGCVLVRGYGEEIPGESLYMRYEARLQQAESSIWSLVGVDGGLFALRRELFQPLDPGTILDDFHLSMAAPLAGKRIVYARTARAVETVLASTRDEFYRKVRIVAGGLQYLTRRAWRGGRTGLWFWWTLLSHKVLRWVAPIPLLALLASSAALWEDPLFCGLLIAQLAFYGLALAAFALPALRRVHVFYIPYYFCAVNLAALLGSLKFAFGQQGVLWKKSTR